MVTIGDPGWMVWFKFAVAGKYQGSAFCTLSLERPAVKLKLQLAGNAVLPPLFSDNQMLSLLLNNHTSVVGKRTWSLRPLFPYWVIIDRDDGPTLCLRCKNRAEQQELLETAKRLFGMLPPLARLFEFLPPDSN